MRGSKFPGLSKSRFIAGLQCHKRLYLTCFHPELADDVSVAQQAIFDSGARVGELAREYYPNGTLIDAPHDEHKKAVEQTLEALVKGAPVYEAAFTHDGVAVRIDILVPKKSGSYDLVEVKSSSEVKLVHIQDVAIQAYVLLGSGFKLRNAYVMHLNSDYVYDGGEHDLKQLFKLKDITDTVRSMQDSVPLELERMRKPLTKDVAPDIAVGDHCHVPYECPFIGHCWPQENAEYPLSCLYYVRSTRKDELRAQGYRDVRELPDNLAGLSKINQRILEVTRSGQMHIDPRAARVLGKLERPIFFMDFETFAPTIPLFPRTGVRQTIPFQWSVHQLGARGGEQHHEFLHKDETDPRPEFIESLTNALGQVGPIVVYTGYEQGCLQAMAQDFPEYADAINDIIARLFDLHPVVRDHVYHPEFRGSFSLKAVVPAMLPEFAYDGMAITEGIQASIAFEELIHPSTNAPRRAKLRAALLTYCERDTKVMVELYRALSG